MNIRNELTKKLNRNIKLDYVHAFISNMNMQSSIWVLYLAFCGMNLMQIGILEGIYHITSVICEIPSGAMADLLGRRKSMILGRILIAISCIIMLFFKGFWFFACSFIVQAMGNNCISGSEEALVYDSMKILEKEQDYMKVNGRINVIIEISQAVATVLGGILAEYSYVWCYSACVVIALLTLIPLLFMVEPPIQGEVTENESINLIKHFKTSMYILKSDRRIFNIVSYYSAIFAAYTMLFFYSQQYFFGLGLNKIQISVIMLFAGGSSCFGALCSEKLFKCLNTKLAKISALVIAFCIMSFSVKRLDAAVIAFLIASFFNALLYPIQSNSLNELIPSEQRATLISVNSMFFSIVMLIIFPVAGALADLFSLAKVFGGLGVIILMVVGLTIRTTLK